MTTSAITISCLTVGCRRRPAKARGTGLCETCHNATVEDHESPLALTGGQWVKDRARGVLIWVPEGKAKP